MGKKNKLRTIYHKNIQNLRTASLGSNFTGSYKKECKHLVVTTFVACSYVLANYATKAKMTMHIGFVNFYTVREEL